MVVRVFGVAYVGRVCRLGICMEEVGGEGEKAGVGVI